MVEITFYNNGQLSIHKDDKLPEVLKDIIDWESPVIREGDLITYWVKED